MKCKENIINLIIIILVTILILSRLFLNVRYEGHDTVFHVTNIIKLSETISFSNILGSNIITYDFNKFGYGIWLFYPKIPHLIGAYTYLLIKDIYLSMKIIYFITTLLSGILIYCLAKKIFNNKNSALLSAVIYITVPYHICEIYTRDAFAENFMFLVLPMIFLGLYNLKDNNYFKFYIFFTLGYIIGMNSHLGSMFFYTILIAIFIIYYHKNFFKKDKIIALLISTIIVTGITLPFLVTLLEHKIFALYRVFTDKFTDLYGVQLSVLDFKSLYIQKPIFNKILPYFSIVTIVLFVSTTIYFVFNKQDNYKKDKKIFLILIVVIVNIICSKVIWEYVPSVLLSIQFPWRLLVFISLMVSLYSPSVLINIKISNSIKRIISIFIIIVLIFEGINNIYYFNDTEVPFEEALTLKRSLGYQNEYLPYVNLEGSDIVQYGDGYKYYSNKKYSIVTDSDVSVKIVEDNFPNMKFLIENLSEETVIEIPRIFYLGYELINEDNEKIELYSNKFGMLEANINKNGLYRLDYVKTKLHRLSEFIRLGTILIVVLVLVVKYIKWRKRKLQF